MKIHDSGLCMHYVQESVSVKPRTDVSSNLLAIDLRLDIEMSQPIFKRFSPLLLNFQM